MKAILMILVAGMILLMTQSIFANSSKVQICHIPSGNVGNFHTITVSEKALGAHLAHGDLSGPCFEAGEILCNDGNACTIDAIDPETGICMTEHPPVDCGDNLLCTTDSCDPAVGCQYAPIDCEDGDLCTVDTCSEFDGQCMSTPIDCGPDGICLSDGLCDYPCDGITCDPIDQCHVAGACVLPGVCDEGVEVADGTPCDDGDEGTAEDQCSGGICAGKPLATCPCFTYEEIVHAVEGLGVAVDDPPNECNKAEVIDPNNGSVIFSERYINWWPARGVLGQALHAVVENNRVLCQFIDWENHPFPPPTNVHYDGWDRMLSCISMMDEALASADQNIQDFCAW